MTIFRAYDIRGIYPEQLNGELSYKIGIAFARFIGKGKIAVGMDARLSGPDLKKNIIKGLRDSGINVIDIGMVPTPALYFTVASMGLDGGAMITGSHNPKKYNGVKLCVKNAVCLSYETGINEVEKIVKESPQSPQMDGNVEVVDIEDDYVDFVTKNVKLEKPIKIVIDAGNGSGGNISSKIFKKLGCEVIEINNNPDGNFPKHHPDPSERKNLAELQAKVKEVNANVGIAYDGDADRVGFIDENGEVIPNNNAFALIIENVLRDSKGSKIIHEVLSSKMVEDVIKASGGVPVISRVGHSYIQEKMSEGAVLGGETSGHYYFAESYNYDDGIFGSVKLIELISKSEKKLSELSNELPKYMTSDDTRIHCPDEKKFDVVKSLAEKFKNMEEVITIDGVKVVLDNSWFIVRASNTQPALVLRWEAKDRTEFERIGNFIKNEVENEIKSIS
ncbi:MAG: phosphomannomutase/phosphoglucomutase [Candidatus Aenigmarchaeota archaeon]|nr:phosphomannomutase/phosphoglucomutase [Candidatus Aenigmarchaeota archaeon]